MQKYKDEELGQLIQKVNRLNEKCEKIDEMEVRLSSVESKALILETRTDYVEDKIEKVKVDFEGLYRAQNNENCKFMLISVFISICFFLIFKLINL